MRLGDTPDPDVDRARQRLRQMRTWLGRRGPRLALFAFLILAVSGAGVIVGFALAGFFGDLNNPADNTGPIGFVKNTMRAVGMDPEDTYLILSGIRDVNIGLPAHVMQGALSNPRRIDLDIAELDYQRLAYEREVALAQGMWLPSDEDYVPVTVRYENQTMDGRARLKGDWSDHWYGEKWSLRFKLNGSDRIEHMREFALQGPRTRNYMAEWFFQQALAREGISGLSYGFVDVTINGKPMGTYAIEEAFDDGITWYNQESPGPLLRFSDTEFFESRAAGNQMSDPERTVALDAFGGKAQEAGYSENQTAAALRLLEQWRSGEIPTRDAFDLDKTARYFALSDLLGNHHGNVFHNMRFYYNPISARLEPVGHDSNSGTAILTITGNRIDDPFFRLFFDDPELTERYLAELERISADGYLESLFAETDSGFKANVSFIYRDQPFYSFNRQPYFDNRATIRKTLHPYRAVSAYVNGTAPAGLVIDLGAAQQIPVEVTAVVAGAARAVPDGGPVRLPGKVLYEPVQFQAVAFTLPAGAAWDPSAPLEVECRVLGTNQLRREGVTPTSRLPTTEDSGRLTRLPANTDSLAFAETDDTDRTVYILPGSHRLDEPLIVPEGYTLRCGPGTSLDLVRNASIIARGPLEWEGTGEHPITVGSSDGTGGGILVLGARNLSILLNVHFEPLAPPIVSVESGILTFLESPVLMDRVSMKGDRNATLLRLADSPFNVTGSAFAGGSAPAVSVEYSKGNFIETLVADGSGLRVSGSVVAIEHGRFERIAGTAVLAERESTVSGTDVACTATGTGLAVESGSTATVDGLIVRDASVAVRAGQANAWFGPGRAVIQGAYCGNVTTPYVPDGGTILVDGQRASP